MKIRINLPVVGIISWMAVFIAYIFLNRVSTIHIIELIVTFAILILVPIIIRDYHRHDIFYRFTRKIVVPFGVITVLSFFMERGFAAALLTLPWFFVTSLLALSGLYHIFKEKEYSFPFPILVNVSHLFIVVGSGWLFVHRTGLEILHFSDKIVLLTAIHFHYAAFITPYILMKSGKVVINKTNRYKSWFSLLAVGTLIGIPIIAIGITFNQLIEFIGMVILVLTLVSYAIFQLALGNKYVNRNSKILLTVASLCVIVGMIFSFIYGFGHLTPDHYQYFISVETMVITHGILNSIGFSLFGILGCLQLIENDKTLK